MMDAQNEIINEMYLNPAVECAKEEAHSDLSRLDVQREFIANGNDNLERSLQWIMYGDEFILEPLGG